MISLKLTVLRYQRGLSVDNSNFTVDCTYYYYLVMNALLEYLTALLDCTDLRAKE